MLIRWANQDERVKYGYADYGDYDVLVAIDRMSKTLLGVLGFNRDLNTMGTPLILNEFHKAEIEEKLCMCAHNQLQPQGQSFHYKFPKYAHRSMKENCGACGNLPMPEGMVDLVTMAHSWVVVEKAAQGRLFGKCTIGSKLHAVDLHDLSPVQLADFMSDVQRLGAVLKAVTGAIKINYEIHGNSGPHLHCHLFPRYLDDDFPSAPIDYRITEPSPYVSHEEFEWFISEMRKGLGASV